MIPVFANYLFPFLAFIADEKVHVLSDATEHLAKHFKLTDEDLSITISSGRTRHLDRCTWAKTWLAQAGLVDHPKRGNFVISAEGKKLLASGITEITQKFLVDNYPSFAAFAKPGKKKSTPIEVPEGTDHEDVSTPIERMDEAYNEYTKNTVNDLITLIKSKDPKFFEELVVKLLVSMGYGGDFEDAAQVTQFSNDGGIDGVIKEDALGLDKIYIQAKRWSDKVVGAPDIQQFIGALMNVSATKGIYITTSHFSQQARNAARTGNLKIVLIDGDQLARYMIKYNVGVVTAQTYELKRVDYGFFEPEE